MIISRGEKIPPNWYVPGINFFRRYGTPKNLADTDIVAFAGGNIKGKTLCGSGTDPFTCIEHVNYQQGLMYDVEENACITHIMLVRHEDSTDDNDAVTLGDGVEFKVGGNGHPACEVFGYDCECEPKDIVDPEPPIWKCANYKDFGKDVPAF